MIFVKNKVKQFISLVVTLAISLNILALDVVYAESSEITTAPTDTTSAPTDTTTEPTDTTTAPNDTTTEPPDTTTDPTDTTTEPTDTTTEPTDTTTEPTDTTTAPTDGTEEAVESDISLTDEDILAKKAEVLELLKIKAITKEELYVLVTEGYYTEEEYEALVKEYIIDVIRADVLEMLKERLISKEELYVLVTDGYFTEEEYEALVKEYLKPLYVSNIMLATDSDPWRAKQAILDSGYIVYDVDLNQGVSDSKVLDIEYLYLGYKTTENPARALTDIRVSMLTLNEISQKYYTASQDGNILYAGVPIVYSCGSYEIDTCSFTGLPTLEALAPEFDWLDKIEDFFVNYVWVVLGEFLFQLADIFTFGVLSEIDTAYDRKDYLAMYVTRSADAGQPILADFFVKHENSYTPDGYVSVSLFGSDIAEDLNHPDYDGFGSFGAFRSTQCNFLYFRSDVSDGNTEYLSSVRLFVGHDASGETRDALFSRAIQENYQLFHENLYTEVNERLILGYRTTKNPYRALTDIKLLAVTRHSNPLPGMINIPEVGGYFGVAYTETRGSNSSGRHFYRSTNWSFAIDTFWQGTSRDDYVGMYVTSSKLAGDPIIAEFFQTDYDFGDNAPEGFSSVDWLGGDGIADFNRGSGEETDSHLYFKRNPVPETVYKYFSEIAIIHAVDKGTATYMALSQGYTGILQDTDRNDGFWDTYWPDRNTFIAYKGTNKKSEAITGIRTYNIKKSDYYNDFTLPKKRVDGDDAHYYKPNQSMTFDNVEYTLAGTVTPFTGETKNIYEQKGSGKHIYFVIKARFEEVESDIITLYTTKSSRAGNPITELFVSDYAISNTHDAVLKTTRGDESRRAVCNMNEGHVDSDVKPAYLLYCRENQKEKKYISNIAVAQNVSKEGALLQLTDAGATNFIDCDFNDDTGGEFVYVGYSKSTNDKEAITGLIFSFQGRQDYEIIHNGITYTLAGHVDFNMGNSGSTDIYLYYTKDPAAGSPITEIATFEHPFEDESKWEIVNRLEGFAANTNDSVKRDPRYLYVKRIDMPEFGKYIGELFVSQTDSWVDAVINAANHKMKNYCYYDFNHTTGGTYVFMSYNRTNNPDEAITGLLSVHKKNPESEIVHKGITYYLASWADFNKGGGGDYIYLYYTKDKKAGDPITDLCGNDYDTLTGWEAVNRIDGGISNFNEGASNKVSYMFIKRTVDTGLSEISSVFSFPNYIFIIIMPLAATIIVFILIRRRISANKNKS